MNISFILQKLKNTTYDYTYSGPMSAEVFAVDLADRTAEFHAGVLYINSADDYQYTHSYETMCILMADPYKIKKIADFVRLILLDEAKLTSAALTLQQKLAAGESATDIAAYLSGIFENPVLMLSPDTTPLAHSGFSRALGLNRFSPACINYLMQCAEKADCVLLESNDINNPFPKRTVFSRINGKYLNLFLFVVEQDNDFDGTDEMHRLEVISRVFRNTLRKKGPSNSEDELQKLLFKLLHTKPVHVNPVKKQLQELNWTFYEKYYVLAIYKKLQNVQNSLVEDLAHIIGEPVYEFGDYYISILHSDWKTEIYALFGRNFPELADYLRKMNLYAGLSYGFFDIVDLSVGMKQAAKCIELLRKYNWVQHFNGYGDMVITHLIDTGLTCGELSLNSVSHPTVLKIREYDKQKGTDLLDVLAAYIFSGQSVKVAAEYLHMHINTVYQRIHKLEEDFGLDFSNRRLITMLHISIIAMAYNGDYPPDMYL